MRKTLFRLSAMILPLAWGAVLHAQGVPGSTIVPGDDDRTTRVGTRGANFLHIPVGARANALGGASYASVDGPSALFWNPANVATREQLSVFLSYTRLYGNSGIADMAAAISVPVGQGAIGVSVRQFSSGDMMYTTERSPQGNDPVLQGSFSWTGTAAAAPAGWTPSARRGPRASPGPGCPGPSGRSACWPGSPGGPYRSASRCSSGTCCSPCTPSPAASPPDPPPARTRADHELRVMIGA